MPANRPAQTFGPWGEPGFEVVISPVAPPCAFWAAQQALQFLNPRVSTVVRVGVDEPRKGVVIVNWASPQEAQLSSTALGITLIAYSRSTSFVMYADMYVKHCDVRLLAHELGHALGLHDTDAPGTLMHWTYPTGGYVLTEEQRRTLDNTGLHD